MLTLEGMQFCYVPPGPFWMGSGDEDGLADDDEKPGHEQAVPYAYWMARYPITVAQYQAFIAAGGYAQKAFWPEAEALGIWSEGLVKRRWYTSEGDEVKEQAEEEGAPHRFGHPFEEANHPIVGLCWYEALAFVRWLTAHWRHEGLLPEGWQVRLPSEAQWEKAARGGAEIPGETISAVIAHLPDADVPVKLRRNREPKRRYPWGQIADPERANYDDSHINATSTVGCFPSGASPYGCKDMAGNAWEWCATKWSGGYQDYEEDNSPEGNNPRVVRGGSFDYLERFARCAYRSRSDPDDRFDLIGFRVVVVPGRA